MSTPMVITDIHRPYIRPTLRAIAVAALLGNALLFLFQVFSSGPDPINLTHIIASLVIAGIVTLRLRWVPMLGALLCGLQFLEGYFFLGHMLSEPDSTTSFAFAALFFVLTLVGLAAGVGSTVQNYRTPRSRPFSDLPAPRWTYLALLVLAVLALGGILSTAIQPRSVIPGFSPEALAALPVLTAKNFQFDQPRMTAKVGETLVIRLENGDTTTHYLDIDELNVHALIPAGKSNVALFKPTQPGTYTFYCHPHGDKAANTGMVGTLIVEP